MSEEEFLKRNIQIKKFTAGARKTNYTTNCASRLYRNIFNNIFTLS